MMPALSQQPVLMYSKLSSSVRLGVLQHLSQILYMDVLVLLNMPSISILLWQHSQLSQLKAQAPRNSFQVFVVQNPRKYRNQQWQQDDFYVPEAWHQSGLMQGLPRRMPLRLKLSLQITQGSLFSSIMYFDNLTLQTAAYPCPVRQRSFLRQAGNLAKKSRRDTITSKTTSSSFIISSQGPTEKPTPAGTSKYSKLALLFQVSLFISKVLVPGLKVKGPFSWKVASRLEQPGPPVSHSTTGSLVLSFSEGKKTQWMTDATGQGLITRLPLSEWSYPSRRYGGSRGRRHRLSRRRQSAQGLVLPGQQGGAGRGAGCLVA